MNAHLRAAALSVAVAASALLLPATAAGQGFGKNPMRTNPELGNLSQLSSGRVDIVYYAPLDTLARLALPIADSCITEMESAYRHRLGPRERVTVFLFGENDDYRQGWVIPGYLTPPSIGYTEPLKGNIGVSFDGDAARLHEVVCHEIAHRFQLSLHESAYAKHPLDEFRERHGKYRFPPWVTEGDATFVSHGFGSLQEMIVRYVVNSGRVNFTLRDMLDSPRSILSYFLGSEFWRFASGEYDSELLADLRTREQGIFSRLALGDSLRVRFFKEQSLYRNPREALTEIYGVPLRELDRAFMLYLNLRYGQNHTRSVDPVMFADRLLEAPDAWSEQPDVVGPRIVQVSPERADTVVDLYYTAVADGYPGLFTRTLPYSGDVPTVREARDPALFDMCVLEAPGDCEEYLAAAPPADASLDGEGLDAEEVGDDDQEERERLEEEAEEAAEEEAELRRDMARAAAEAIAARPRRVVRSGTEPCQSLDPRVNRLEAYLDGDRRLLAYVCTDSRSQSRVIGIRDVASGDDVERYEFPDLSNVSSPTWSPDGTHLAFAGISRSGTWDLYTIRRADAHVRRLTADIYADGAPDWSPDGRTIVFTSDRTPFGEPGESPASNLFLLDVESGAVAYLTRGRWIDLAPRWSPDGRTVLFSSDRGGAFDLYVASLEGDLRRLTTVSTGILSAEWWPDGESVVFTAFDGQSQIFRMDVPGESEQLAAEGVGDPWTPTWNWDDELSSPVTRLARARPLPDRFHLTLGDVGGAVGSQLGLTGLSLVYTTLDNSRLLFTQFQSAFHTGDTRIRTGIGKYQNLYAAAGYLNLNERTFWGLTCYRQAGLFVDDVYNNIFGEDHLGCRVSGQYPLSLFRRWEFSLGAEYSDQADLRDLDILTFDRLRAQKDDITFTRRAALLQAGAAYVKDNTLWVGRSYPVDGMRYRLDCRADFDVGRFRPDTYMCRADGRLYVRLGATSNVGLRGFLFHSDGFTSRRFTLDWRNHMTLYPAFGLYGQRGWIGNAFLAFPLIERLSIGVAGTAINFPPIRGAFFADFGQAWLNDQDIGPVWADAGIRATMPIGPYSLGVAWGGRWALGGDVDLPERFKGSTWRFLLIGTP